jgi:hypothetical protein
LSVTIQASDDLLGAAVSVDYHLQVSDVNDAPVLDNSLSPTLTTLSEDPTSNYGTPTYALTYQGISDQDVGALKGIAITGASDYHGRWEYSLNSGMTWLSMGQPTASGALLLPSDGLTLVRFTPNANFHGVVKLWYQAWDRTQGTAGGTMAVVGNSGGSGTLSAAVENAALTVQSVNDNPLLNITGSVGYKLNASPILLAPYARVSDVDSPNFGGGTLRVSIGAGSDASNRLEIGGLFTVTKNKVLYGGLQIGTRTSSGVGTNDLIVKFTSRATPEIVQELIRALTFRTYRSTTTINRSVYFQLTDGDGGASLIQNKIVNLGTTTSVTPPPASSHWWE